MIKNSLRFVKRKLRPTFNKYFYYGNKRFCPICENSFRLFLAHGRAPRKNAACPFCDSLERHRLSWLYISTKTSLFEGKPKKMLHVAPERSLENKFKKLLDNDYLTADLFNPKAMVKMDITNIEYPPDTFDVIYCSHVLEHVQDDKKAMRELYRVLKNSGWAILDVPINAEQTLEDPTMTDPQERLEVFGQEDHVRKYGPDYANRLRDAGFIVDVIMVEDLLNNDEAVKLGLSNMNRRLHFCTKK